MIAYPQILADVKAAATASLRSRLEILATAEVVEVATFLGPLRLAALAGAPEPQPAPLRPSGASPWPLTQLLAQISQQAFGRPLAALRAIRPDPVMVREIAAALVGLETRRRLAPLLTMTEDVTGILPTPSAVPPPLSEADYQAAATRNNVSVPAIKAVAKVESGGRNGFDAQGRPKILFEAHHFGPLTQHRFDHTHPHLSVRTRQQARAFYGWDQYERLREAMVLEIDAALQAASWGKFQVLGEYHDGWPEVRSFVAAMYVSEVNHLRAFEAHCGAALFDALRRKDWLAFAKGYNGEQQQGYDSLISTAYAQAGGR